MRYIFLICWGFSGISHPHKIKAPSYQYKYSIPLPYIHLVGKMFRSEKETAINLLEYQGSKNPVHHMENRIFCSCST